MLKIPFGYITLGLFMMGVSFEYLNFYVTGATLILISALMFIIFFLTKPFKEYYYNNGISVSLKKKLLFCDLLFNILIIGLFIYFVTFGYLSEDKVGLPKALANSEIYAFWFFILLLAKTTIKFFFKITFK
jgi:hypothetical protein